MANKKITQLNTVDSAIGIGSESMFPVASGSPTDTYLTSKVSSVDIAKYVLNPMPVGGSTDLSSIGFTGSSNIKFKKTNWENANTNVEVNPYLQVRLSDGQLITGSGVAVPAALGDDLGDHTATEPLNLAGYDVIRANEIYFGGTSSDDYAVIDSSYYAGTPRINVLKIRSDDLTLSGTRHVSISGQALDLASTPISGNVTITGGNLEIDPGNKLIINEIGMSVGSVGTDKATLSIDGASLHVPYNTNEWTNLGVVAELYWNESNIQYATLYNGNSGYLFNAAYPGQTFTMYVENASSTTPHTPTFSTPVSSGSNKVLWGGTGGPPHIEQGRTNIYTFACYDGVIFASAITGYEY
tara:strand:+ start:1863 stop:2927 length:1065 start_codon:yes stop_codon:yes gene_type:complete